MSLQFGHVAFNHTGLTLNDLEGHTLRRRLPLTYPFWATWAVYMQGNTTDDYMTLFAYGKDTAFDGTLYYTAATIPSVAHGGAPPMKWSCGANGFDDPQDYVSFNQWYYQGYRAFRTATDTIHEFYYNLPDITKKASIATGNTTYFAGPGTTHMFRWGDVPWAENEGLDGLLAGIKMGNAYATPQDLWFEARSPWPQVPRLYPSLWDMLPCITDIRPTVEGIRKKNGRQWQFPDPTVPPTLNPRRPDLWSRYGGPPSWLWNNEFAPSVAAPGGGGVVPLNSLLGVGLGVRMVAAARLSQPQDRREFFKTLIATAIGLKK